MLRTPEQVRDEWLVVSSQAGSGDAICELLRRWHARLLEHARLLTRNDADAADAVQESLIAIAGYIRRLDDPALFWPWARRIVAHKCADLIRTRKRARSQASTAPPPPSEHHAASDSDDSIRIRLAIEMLPPEQRALIAMRYGRDMSVAQIAAAFGIPEGTVKSRLSKARHELQHTLERNI